MSALLAGGLGAKRPLGMGGQQSPPSLSPMQQRGAGIEADAIVINARVLTQDLALPRAEAIAIKDGRFLAVGSNADVRNLATRRTKVIDAARMTVLPGFIRRVFYSADSGPMSLFTTIAERLGPFDLSLMEIGAWHPSWGSIHLGPAGALEAFDQLGGGTLMPVHWATFDLAVHHWSEPAETLVDLAGRAGVRVVTPRVGEAIEPLQVAGATPWWRAVS